MLFSLSLSYCLPTHPHLPVFLFLNYVLFFDINTNNKYISIYICRIYKFLLFKKIFYVCLYIFLSYKNQRNVEWCHLQSKQKFSLLEKCFIHSSHFNLLKNWEEEVKKELSYGNKIMEHLSKTVDLKNVRFLFISLF